MITYKRANHTGSWQATLRGALRSHGAALGFPHSPVQSFLKEEVHVAPNASLCARLAEFSAREGVSHLVAALAALGFQAARYTGMDEAVIDLGSSDRIRANQIGNPEILAKQVALRIDLTGNPTVRDLLYRISQGMEESAKHLDSPLAWLFEQFAPNSTPQPTSTFSTMLISGGLTDGEPARNFQTESQLDATADNAAHSDLCLQITANDTGLSLTYEYNAELFER